MKLTATKSFLYNTRRLLAGDEFEVVRPIHGKLLIAAKKAREIRPTGKIAPPPAALKAKIAAPTVSEPVLDPDGNPGSDTAPPLAGDEMVALRAEYQDKVGKRPFMGWDADTLRAKMAEALAEAAAAPAPTEAAPAAEDTDEEDAAS